MMGPEKLLTWADRAYFGAAIVAALATAVTIIAGLAQNRLSARISSQKDRAFSEYKQSTNVQIAAANQAAAEANQRTAQLRADNLKLKEALSPREILGVTSEQTWLLAPFAGKTVTVQSYALDVESAEFGGQILQLLKNSGISVHDQRMSLSVFGSISLGVSVSGPNTALVSALVATLRGLNILVNQGPSSQQGASISAVGAVSVPDATIFVGAKPPRSL